MNANKKHNIRLDDFQKVFNEDIERFPLEKHEFIFDLMKEYELAFETDKEKRLIIPHLLKKDRPETLPKFSVGDSLMLRYVAEQPLPPNTISRFIVRHNEEIKKESNKYIVWRYGVVLEDGKGSLALVREDDRTIIVSVKGKEKTNFISTLRETLNDIFNSYKSDKTELQYRFERHGEIPPDAKDLWLADRKIKNLNEKNKSYYDDETNQEIPMSSIVNNYNINASNTTIAGHNIDNSTHNTFNFKDCNIGLQGNLNELAQLLNEGGKKEEAKELENVAKVLEQVENSENKEEIKKKGILNRLQRVAQDLGDKNSELYKTVEGIKYGVGIAKNIVVAIANFSQMLG